MSAKLRIGGRLRARLRGEVRVYGLRAPAVIRLDGPKVDLQDPDDGPIVWGFAAAERSMLAIDLERRLWSGRLAEVFGGGLIGGVPAPDLDIFVRLLGLRERAERRMRTLDDPTRGVLDSLAAGMNAWSDAKRWEQDDAWTALDTRPRLMGAADLLLLGTARARAARLVTTVPPPPPGWQTQWTPRLQALLDAVHSATSPQQPGAGSTALDGELGPPSLEPEPPETRPGLHQVTVLSGGDDQRVVHGDGWVRMSVRRPDVAVRAAEHRRPWLRRAPSGPLISDLLTRAEANGPPTGDAVSFAWERSDGVIHARGEPSNQSGTIRLVPLTEGA